MSKLSIEEGRFIAQISRPSYQEAITEAGFKFNFWKVVDEDSLETTVQYKQRRLYVKSFAGRFSDDLGYIDLLTGEIVPSKPRFAQKLQSFVDMVEEAYAEFLKENPAYHGDGEKKHPVLSVEILDKIQNQPGRPTYGLRASYGGEYAVEVFETLSGSGTYDLFFYRNGEYKSRMVVNEYYGLKKVDTPVIERLNEALSYYQPDESKWMVVEIQDAKALIYPKNKEWNNFSHRTVIG